MADEIGQVTQVKGVKKALQGVQQGARKVPFPGILIPRFNFAPTFFLSRTIFNAPTTFLSD